MRERKGKEYTVKVYDTGTKKWCLNDRLHREEGPAIEWADGTLSWYLNGIQLTQEKWEKRLKKPSVTKEDVDKAYEAVIATLRAVTEAKAKVNAVLDKYIELKKEYGANDKI